MEVRIFKPIESTQKVVHISGSYFSENNQVQKIKIKNKKISKDINYQIKVDHSS